VVSDLDIYRSAKVLLDQHGEGATREAETRAESLAAKGVAEGAAVWRRILVAVRELQRDSPDDMAQH